jgi:Ca-activated chloride channel family protein
MIIRQVSLVLALLLFPHSSVRNQEKPAATRPAPVMMTVTVSDCHDGYAYGLKREWFEITDERTPRELNFFEAGNSLTSVGIVIDLSGSMSFTRQIPGRASGDAMAYFLGIANPDNEYFLLSFSKSPTLLVDWTNPYTLLHQRGNMVESKGNTALYDACFAAIDRFHTARYPRQVLVLISDGQDNLSKKSFRDLIRLLKRSDIVLYAIKPGRAEGPSSLDMEGMGILEELAKTTGGRAFDVGSYDEMIGVFGMIAEELKHQYRIGFMPDWTSEPNKWHQLRIKLAVPPDTPGNGKLCYRSRKGYYTQR